MPPPFLVAVLRLTVLRYTLSVPQSTATPPPETTATLEFTCVLLRVSVANPVARTPPPDSPTLPLVMASPSTDRLPDVAIRRKFGVPLTVLRASVMRGLWFASAAPTMPTGLLMLSAELLSL